MLLASGMHSGFKAQLTEIVAAQHLPVRCGVVCQVVGAVKRECVLLGLRCIPFETILRCDLAKIGIEDSLYERQRELMRG